MDMFRRTLIISPHCDDETIGCGGLINDLVEKGNDVHVVLVGTHAKQYERYTETLTAMEILGLSESNIIRLQNIPDGAFDQIPRKVIVSQLDNIIDKFKPTAVLFPYSSHHQDHQVLYQACIAALRPKVSNNFIELKAAYEYPYITTSWNSNMRSDSKIYYALSNHNIEKKTEALRAYKSQLSEDTRDILSVPSIINLAKVRGTEIGHEYAEVFYPLSIVIERS